MHCVLFIAKALEKYVSCFFYGNAIAVELAVHVSHFLRIQHRQNMLDVRLNLLRTPPVPIYSIIMHNCILHATMHEAVFHSDGGAFIVMICTEHKVLDIYSRL